MDLRPYHVETPFPIRRPKLINVEIGTYLDGRPLANSRRSNESIGGVNGKCKEFLIGEPNVRYIY